MVRGIFFFLLIYSSFVFGQTQRRVGESANRDFKMPYGSFIATWDGRVAIFPASIGGAQYRWDAYAIRYENIAMSAKGEPQMQDSRVYSPVVAMDGDYAYGDPRNKLGISNRMHLALAPDSDFKLNPFPSDSSGRPVTDLRSEYLTYRALIVGQAQESQRYKPTRSVPGLFVVSTAEIILKNPGRSDTSIIKARVLTEGQVIRQSADSEPFFGFEPTLSSDGRLLIWAGNPNNGGIHFLMYSFNPNPKLGVGWSRPRHLTEMYSVHGAGSASETIVDGLKFSDRYPIAKKQLKDPYGVPFQPLDGYPGAYPWLSLDNSEIFCPTVSTFFAAKRSAYAVIGRLTGYAARHIEGAINVTRANVTGRSDIWLNTSEGQELEAKYNALTNEFNRPYSSNVFQRIMISPLGQFPSLWQPYAESSLPRNRQALPFSDKRHTFGAILSHSDRYVEISLPETADGNFVAYYPMNEALNFSRADLKKVAATAEVQNWDDVYRMVTYDPARTPDISGYFQTGQLIRAQFPFEYLDAVGRWRNSRQLVDRTVGLEGNSIFFPPNSYVFAQLQAITSELIQASRQWNVSFLFRAYTNLQEESLFLWENQFQVSAAVGTLKILARQNGNWVVVRTVNNAYQKNQWHHVSFNSRPGAVELYIDGDLIYAGQVQLDLPAGPRRLWMGPSTSAQGGGSALFSLDEVSVSRVARTSAEIQGFALWKRALNSQADRPNGDLLQKELGQKIFFDPILSRDQTVSCSTCHQPQNQFADGRALAVGIGGALGARNTPALWNVGFFETLMWDGRARNLAEQALLPIENPKEMDLPISEALTRLAAKYSADFLSAFGAGPTETNLGQALAAFQADLTPQPTAFDHGQLTAEQLEGKGLFFGKARCATCHQGPLMTDHGLHNLGFFPNLDLGAQNVTGRLSDRLKFRTPSLRSVQHTGPYFHDGRFANLDQVLGFYNRGGDSSDGQASEILPLALDPKELRSLKAFLLSL